MQEFLPTDKQVRYISASRKVVYDTELTRPDVFTSLWGATGISFSKIFPPPTPFGSPKNQTVWQPLFELVRAARVFSAHQEGAFRFEHRM